MERDICDITLLSKTRITNAVSACVATKRHSAANVRTSKPSDNVVRFAHHGATVRSRYDIAIGAIAP